MKRIKLVKTSDKIQHNIFAQSYEGKTKQHSFMVNLSRLFADNFYWLQERYACNSEQHAAMISLYLKFTFRFSCYFIL